MTRYAPGFEGPDPMLNPPMLDPRTQHAPRAPSDLGGGGWSRPGVALPPAGPDTGPAPTNWGYERPGFNPYGGGGMPGGDINAGRDAITQTLMGIRNPPGGFPGAGGLPGMDNVQGGGSPWQNPAVTESYGPPGGAPPMGGGGALPWSGGNPLAQMKGQPGNPFAARGMQPQDPGVQQLNPPPMMY